MKIVLKSYNANIKYFSNIIVTPDITKRIKLLSLNLIINYFSLIDCIVIYQTSDDNYDHLRFIVIKFSLILSACLLYTYFLS